MSRGITIAAFMIALTMATFTLGAVGWYNVAGVGYDTGLEQDVDDTNDQVNNPQGEAVGSEQIGFFGVAVGVLRGLATLGSLTYKTQAILQSWGVHWSIAYSIQAMVDFAFGITLYAAFRGYQLVR